MKKKRILKTCENGHRFYKSSNCPVCPVCEKEQKGNNNFLSLLASPARRALENNGISNLEELSKYTEKEILSLHGIGKTSIPKLKEMLSIKKLKFKN